MKAASLACGKRKDELNEYEIDELRQHDEPDPGGTDSGASTRFFSSRQALGSFHDLPGNSSCAVLRGLVEGSVRDRSPARFGNLLRDDVARVSRCSRPFPT